MNHLCNIHEDYYHDPLDNLDERQKKWFIPGILGSKATLVTNIDRHEETAFCSI